MAKSKKKKRNPPAPPTPDPFKPPDFSNRRELEAVYTRLFARSVERGKSVQKDFPEEIPEEFLDIDPVHIRRRKNAALKYLDHAKQLVSDLCPEIPGAFYIEQEWADINALIVLTYDIYEYDERMVFATALWLLDRVQENDRMEELLRILPNDTLPFEGLDSPVPHDPSFSGDLIACVVRLIQDRNADCTGLKITTPKPGSACRFYMDDYTAARRQHQEVPSRKRFETLLSLAGQENLERAAERYESKLWEIVQLYFAFRKPYTEEEREYAEQRERYRNMMQQNTVTLMNKYHRRESNGSPAAEKPNVLTPLAKQPAQALFSSPRNLMERNPMSLGEEILLAIEEVERELDKLDTRHAKMLSDNATRCIRFCDSINYSREALTELMDANCAELLTGFDIGDPYEMSAALLWLIDTDSDLPWLYFPGACMMNAIFGRFPWHKGDFCTEEDSWWNRGYGDDRFHLAEGAARPKSLAMPEPVDWYGLNHLGTFDGSTDLERTNLAQIVYMITGSVIPRNTIRYNDAAVILKRFGITGKRALAPILPSINMLGTCAHQESLAQHFVWPSDEPEPEEPAEETEDPEVYKQTIREMKQQIASLKQAHYDAAREAKNAQKRLEEKEKTWETERRELANLRELIYNQAQGTAEAAPLPKNIEFPYSPSHRIVVFGGHDSWLKAIRPLLPDVRFVGTQPNADLIRHADMVWIQPNCIGHGDFYKVINVVRAHHIPIFYFSCAGASKCAEELIQADLKGLNG